MAQKEQLIEINPYDNDQIEILEELESKDMALNLSSKLKKITISMSEDDYKKSKRKSNTIDELLALEENGIVKGLLSITGEKDIRTSLITIHYINKCQPKKIIFVGTDYALKSMGMQEVFINVSVADTSTRKYLEEMGYEYIGEESGIITYLKDQGAKEQESIIAYS